MSGDVSGETDPRERPTGDELAAVVQFHREHGDTLAVLATRVPVLLGEAAEALTDAADDLASAADFLTGRKRAGGVKEFAGTTADALDAGRHELAGEGLGEGFGDRLGDAAVELRRLGAALDRSGHGLASAASRLQASAVALGRGSLG